MTSPLIVFFLSLVIQQILTLWKIVYHDRLASPIHRLPLNVVCFSAPTLWHSDAAERAPSTASKADAPQKLHHQAGRSLLQPTAGHGRPQLVSVGCERRYFDPLLSLS